MDNGTNSGGINNTVQWYSDGPIAPPYPRTKQGTIILGSGRDGVAVLSVRGTTGSEVARIDKNGISISNNLGTNIVTVNDQGIVVNTGNIIIKDANGSTVIDANGLNSINNFETITSSTSIQEDTTNNAYAPLPSGTITTSNFARSKNVLVLFTAQYTIDGSGTAAYDAFANYLLFVDGTSNATMFMTKRASRVQAGTVIDSNQNRWSTETMHSILMLGTGVHNIVINRLVSRSSGTPTVTLSTFRRTLTGIILGN